MNSVAFSSCAGILRHLEGRGFFHMDLSLDRMEAALRALGLTRPPFLVAQVLGTNGKGSTSAFLSSLARAHGHRAGLYTSPHFLLPEERIRIDGRPLPCASWVDAANEVVRHGPDLTYFEFLTVLAVALFARAGVSLAVMEAGLGGRYDATTALAADVLAYAPIAKDHAAVLGSTLRRIAADKAAAIRSAAPVFSAPQFPDAGEDSFPVNESSSASLSLCSCATHASTFCSLSLRAIMSGISSAVKYILGCTVGLSISTL